MNIGDKLLFLRNRSGCSQENLADALDVSRQTVSKWELGQSLPDAEKIVAISNFFSVTTDFLLRDTSPVQIEKNLDRIVIEFANSASDLDKISKDLVDIARDGIIDEEERLRLFEMVKTVDNIIPVISEIKTLLNM
ncbi:helix-turn-helix domain-containing protein [Ruminococcus sp.]|uniref:helix-turn-helix domain-containing protein n=1 Tax=Ruminococcus sp. TaxID=41978 RepID=UPI0025D9F0B2|nr:helix-turn-helix domain-containing protein [Ruminococcus sp.]MBQ8966873.1 helix-turn-helix domain-containing protein [Ruminococcus sp.]